MVPSVRLLQHRSVQMEFFAGVHKEKCPHTCLLHLYCYNFILGIKHRCAPLTTCPSKGLCTGGQRKGQDLWAYQVAVLLMSQHDLWGLVGPVGQVDTVAMATPWELCLRSLLWLCWYCRALALLVLSEAQTGDNVRIFWAFDFWHPYEVHDPYHDPLLSDKE